MYHPSGRLPRHLLDGLNGPLHVLAFGFFADILIVDPAPAVARHFMTALDHSRRRLGVTLQCHADGQHGGVDLAFLEQAQQPPEPDPAAILVDRFHVHVTHAHQGLGADDLGQERLGGRVAVEDAILASLLVGKDDLHRDPGAVGPIGVGGIPAVADHVPRIVHPSCSSSCPIPLQRRGLFSRASACSGVGSEVAVGGQMADRAAVGFAEWAAPKLPAVSRVSNSVRRLSRRPSLITLACSPATTKGLRNRACARTGPRRSAREYAT